MDAKETLESFELDARFLYEAMESSTDDYLFIVDMQRDLALVSTNMCEDFNLPGRLVSGLIPLWHSFVADRDRNRFDEGMRTMLSGKTNRHDIECQVRNSLGEDIWVMCRGLLKRDDTDKPALFAGVVTRLECKGKIDPVTGLFAHDECIGFVERLIDCESEGSVMLLGLDDFSRINALNGHAFGNAVLKAFAQSIQQLSPEGSSLFRLDGDMLAIVVRGADRAAMEKLYRAIHLVANYPHTVDGLTFLCTASAGIAMIDPTTPNAQKVLDDAENALEESKLRGKNTSTFFSTAMTATKRRRLEISDYMQTSALQGMKGFELYYQPLADAETMELAGAEALLRWHSDEHGQLSPIEFIPVLESYGLIGQVGRWVLEQSFAQCKRWAEVHPGFIMNVNISYLQLLDTDFIPFVEKLINDVSIDPASIVLEMTESSFVTDMDRLRTAFDHLRAIGIRVAMDDFGTGYSSLSLLSQSPADIVKIDRLFIKNIHEETFNRAFIDAVIDLCHSVGIEVTVEGVEESTELDAVRTIGADSIQGFFISRPIPARIFEERFLTPQTTF